MSADESAPAVFQLLAPGLAATLQDTGRPGWRRFGVPSSGAMDAHAAATANLLVGNALAAPLLELLLQGASLLVLRDVWVAVTGAEADATVPRWQAVRLAAGQRLEFPRNRAGVWIYVATAGGLVGERVLGSASAYPRGGLGRALAAGDSLHALAPAVDPDPLVPCTPRDYLRTPVLRVWVGPQWESFSEAARAAFFEQPWTVSSQSDRVGYRLTGQPLAGPGVPLLSEPVLPGTIQVPANGLPIVTMRDGPTVGGYPKLGVLEPGDVSWLAQCRPGQTVRFKPVP